MEAGSEVEALAVVWDHILGVTNSLVLKCAVNLDIIGLIRRHGGPMPLPDLSAALPVPCSNLTILRRVMRYLAHMRLVTIEATGDGDVSYGLTPASAFLAKDDARSLVPFVQLGLDEGYIAPMHALELCLDGDPSKSAYERVKGESLWECASRDPARNQLFNEAMSCSARMVTPAMIGACRGSFERMGSVVDVGGGSGTAARAIVEAFPHVKCTIFDLPHVVEASPVQPAGIKYAAGDMFDSVPRADAVLLMWILHNWTDDDSLKILRRCREAIPDEGGMLIIVDVVIDEDQEHALAHTRLALDVIMMAYTGGKERTEKEWRELLSRAGFSKCKITPVMALQHVIEAQP